MRALWIVALGLLVSTATADARPKRTAKAKKTRVAMVAKATSRERARPRRIEEPDKPDRVGKLGKTGKGKRGKSGKKAERPKLQGQSIGAPWSGWLRSSAEFRAPERTHVRRPQRVFATRTTIEHTRRAIVDTLEAFPKAHDLAIGDFSAPSGGWISEHHSHQSGRDVDLGLFYKTKPAGYPASFVKATEDTLYCAATWALITNLAATSDEDGGVAMMFLDFELQGVIYEWAKEVGVSDERLERILQYPHGRGSSAGLVRHEPNHDNHLHVRFKCQAGDTSCR